MIKTLKFWSLWEHEQDTSVFWESGTLLQLHKDGNPCPERTSRHVLWVSSSGCWSVLYVSFHDFCTLWVTLENELNLEERSQTPTPYLWLVSGVTGGLWDWVLKQVGVTKCIRIGEHHPLSRTDSFLGVEKTDIQHTTTDLLGSTRVWLKNKTWNSFKMLFKNSVPNRLSPSPH